MYIATREGVDLTSTSYEHSLQEEILSMENPDEQTAAPNDLYVKYIAERPRSNGLFGNIKQLDPVTLGNIWLTLPPPVEISIEELYLCPEKTL